MSSEWPTCIHSKGSVPGQKRRICSDQSVSARKTPWGRRAASPRNLVLAPAEDGGETPFLPLEVIFPETRVGPLFCLRGDLWPLLEIPNVETPFQLSKFVSRRSMMMIANCCRDTSFSHLFSPLRGWDGPCLISPKTGRSADHKYEIGFKRSRFLHSAPRGAVSTRQPGGRSTGMPQSDRLRRRRAHGRGPESDRHPL